MRGIGAGAGWVGELHGLWINEVTSRNTEKRDRGVKLDDYRSLTALREYAIVSHLRQEVEVWSRKGPDDEWTRRIFTAGKSSDFT